MIRKNLLHRIYRANRLNGPQFLQYSRTRSQPDRQEKNLLMLPQEEQQNRQEKNLLILPQKKQTGEQALNKRLKRLRKQKAPARRFKEMKTLPHLFREPDNRQKTLRGLPVMKKSLLIVLLPESEDRPVWLTGRRELSRHRAKSLPGIRLAE